MDISKAFDKESHEGLLLKPKSNDIDAALYLLIQDFLAEGGKTSSRKHISAGVPQGSVLGPLFFLIYVNDLSENVSSQVKLFADDTSIYQIVSDVNSSWQIPSNDHTRFGLSLEDEFQPRSIQASKGSNFLHEKNEKKSSHILSFNDY